MCPHLFALNGLHHPGSQHFQLEVRVLQCKGDTRQATGQKNCYRQGTIFCIPPEDSRVFLLKEPENRPGTRAMPQINDIVCPRHQLIEIARKMDRTWVLPDCS